jgi:hypothetical protein
MKLKWRHLLLAGVLLSAAALALLLIDRSPDKVTKENAGKIPGMTQAEVEALLGGPPGRYYIGGGRRYWLYGPAEGRFVAGEPAGFGETPFRLRTEDRWESWVGYYGGIAVAFDRKTGRARATQWTELTLPQRTPWQALTDLLNDTRAWLGL